MLKQLVAYGFIILFALILLYLAFFASMSYNAQTPSFFIKSFFNKSMPQGWGFFTKDPRIPLNDIYKVVDDSISHKVFLKNTEKANLFGVSRLARRQFMELGMILEKANHLEWESKTNLNRIQIPKKINQIDNDYLKYIEDGKYIIIERSTVPWAWVSITDNTMIEYKILYILIGNKND